jgi:hypothetical protein
MTKGNDRSWPQGVVGRQKISELMDIWLGLSVRFSRERTGLEAGLELNGFALAGKCGVQDSNGARNATTERCKRTDHGNRY